MKLKIIVFILTSIILSACSFNKVFLRPTKIPADTKRLITNTSTDTTLITFVGNNFQPTFLKNEVDTIDLDFTIESVVFESASGNKLNGWFITPKHITPTITLFHLHGNAGSIISQEKAITPLIKYGFQIFMFDYSGFGFSEGAATRENVLIDANSALDYLKKRPEIVNTKLVIYGQSLGGNLSAVVAEQRESEIDGLVIEGAFSSHRDLAADRAGFFGRLLINEKYSSFTSIRSVEKPVLVIHSTEDKVVPFKLGKKIFDNANEHKEFYEIEKRHIYGPRVYSKEIAQKIKRMLQVE